MNRKTSDLHTRSSFSTCSQSVPPGALPFGAGLAMGLHLRYARTTVSWFLSFHVRASKVNIARDWFISVPASSRRRYTDVTNHTFGLTARSLSCSSGGPKVPAHRVAGEELVGKKIHREIEFSFINSSSARTQRGDQLQPPWNKRSAPRGRDRRQASVYSGPRL